VAPKGVGVQIPPSAPLHSKALIEVRSDSEFMIILVTIVHIIVCFFIIVVVLLQSGNAGDISSAFGGQGSQAAFGPRGAATALTKATTISAVIFMLTSITLSIHSTKHGGPTSVLQGVKSTPTKTQPIAPKPAPPAQK
jgi:preprotein translocase subunit SecG